MKSTRYKLAVINLIDKCERFESMTLDRILALFLKKVISYKNVTGADPGFDQGGAQIVTGLNC